MVAKTVWIYLMPLGLTMVKMENFTYLFYHNKKKSMKANGRLTLSRNHGLLVRFTHPTGDCVWAREPRATSEVQRVTA